MASTASKYSEPLEGHCSHGLECEMVCEERRRGGNITPLRRGHLGEDIDLERFALTQSRKL